MLLLHELVLDSPDCEWTGVDTERNLGLNFLENADLHMLDLHGQDIHPRRELAYLVRVGKGTIDVRETWGAGCDNLLCAGRRVFNVKDDDVDFEERRMARACDQAGRGLA